MAADDKISGNSRAGLHWSAKKSLADWRTTTGSRWSRMSLGVRGKPSKGVGSSTWSKGAFERSLHTGAVEELDSGNGRSKSQTGWTMLPRQPKVMVSLAKKA